MTKQTWLVALTFVAVFLVFPAIGKACVTCASDYETCSGFTRSDFFQCNTTANCLCAEGVSFAYLDALHPGFIVRQSAGRLVVAALIFTSPASQAGVLPGDEIVLINGKKPSDLPCASRTWQSLKTRDTAFVQFRRGGKEWETTLALVPVRQLLDTAWLGSAAGSRPVSLKAAGSPETRKAYGPYVLGIQWVKRGTEILVTDVLYGSPAYLSGVAVGDKVIAIDRVPVSEATHELEAKLLPGDGRVKVALTIQRGGGQRGITLTTAGVASVLSRLDRRSSEPLPQVTQMTFSAPDGTSDF